MKTEEYVELYTELAELLYKSRHSKIWMHHPTEDEMQDLYNESCNEVEEVLSQFNLKED